MKAFLKRWLSEGGGSEVGTAQESACGSTTVAPIGSFGEGGTYAVLLSKLISPLPSGIFKVLVDGGSSYSAVEMLQVNAASATTLQVAFDTTPTTGASATPVQRPNARRSRIDSTPKPVFNELPR